MLQSSWACRGGETGTEGQVRLYLCGGSADAADQEAAGEEAQLQERAREEIVQNRSYETNTASDWLWLDINKFFSLH